jgi:hypothetical protein
MSLTQRRIIIAVAVIAVLGAATFGLSRRTASQQRRPSTSAASSKETQQIENSADQPLRILENNDSPLRIMDAKVKEVSGSEFTKLTGQHTSLMAVCTVPEVHLLNSSPQTITAFILVIRDPLSKTIQAIDQTKVSIAQGDTYTVPRQAFVRPEQISTVDNDGQIKTHFGQPDMSSEKWWINFARRADLYVTVARVTFEDGSKWTIKEGGDIR